MTSLYIGYTYTASCSYKYCSLKLGHQDKYHNYSGKVSSEKICGLKGTHESFVHAHVYYWFSIHKSSLREMLFSYKSKKVFSLDMVPHLS